MLIFAQINGKLHKNIKDKNSYFESSLKNLQKSTHTEFLDPRMGKKGKRNNFSKYKYEYQNP